MPQTAHPIVPLVDGELVRLVLTSRGVRDPGDGQIRDCYRELVRLREAKLEKERKEPLIYGWEPPIWRVCDALLGLDWAIPEKFGKDYGARMRAHLGFDDPVSLLLILGGNRAGKSEYMAKRASQCLNKFDRTTLWAFHTDNDMSVQYHQPLFWKYMPSVWRTNKPIQTQTAYIAYKKKTGFSDGSFILPNGSWCDFRYYAQDRIKIEGGELGCADAGGDVCLGMIADELIPEDWVETLVLRLATRGASGVIGFTPVNGYTGTVKSFLDGAKVVKESKGYLLQRDGGDVDERCIDLEDCDAWIGEGDGVGRGGDSRSFESVPRVMRCADKRRAVVYFHSSDNPYGNPREVMLSLLARDTKFKKERFYGIADKLIAGKFPLFDPGVHVIGDDRIPKHGTNYMLCDPCDGRNFFMIWVRCTPDGRMYVYREWPSQFDAIPGYGVLGEWALPTGDTKMLDGRRGPAQSGLGWGLLQYKREIARLERWEEYEEGADDDAVREWHQYEEDLPRRYDVSRRERINARFLDARFGNTRSLEADGTRTLFEEFDLIGLNFRETGADVKKTIGEGVQLINAALYYNVEKPVVTDLNEPKLYVSEKCANVAFALQTWTGLDGPKGSTKDCIDLLRYAYLKDLDYVDESPESVASMNGTGCY